jgi:bacillithiol system protein YtxJ
MEFLPLQSPEQLSQIKEAEGYNIIFKHNTTCPISKGVKERLEQDGEALSAATVYIVDLIANRTMSDAVAEEFGVEHQSPQLLVIKNGECTYNEALYAINVEETANAIAE